VPRARTLFRRDRAARSCPGWFTEGIAGIWSRVGPGHDRQTIRPAHPARPESTRRPSYDQVGRPPPAFPCHAVLRPGCRRLYVSTSEGTAKTSIPGVDPPRPRWRSPAQRAGRGHARARSHSRVRERPHGSEVEAIGGLLPHCLRRTPGRDEYRSVMVSDRRVLMAMTVDHVYGAKVG